MTPALKVGIRIYGRSAEVMKISYDAIWICNDMYIYSVSDGFYVLNWRVALGRTPVCRKHSD